MIRKFMSLGLASFAALLLMSSVGVATVSAQAALPYKAYGSKLPAGSVVDVYSRSRAEILVPFEDVAV